MTGTAHVVGSGPNGLVGAIALARAGLDVTVWEAADTVGGATRSAPVLGPGTVVDLGSAVHPFGVASPALRAMDLQRHGLHWLHPEVPMAHVLDERPAVLLHRSLERTADELGADAGAWKRVHRPVVQRWEATTAGVLGPVLRPPSSRASLSALTRFGVRGVWPATSFARAMFRDAPARALFAGSAVHSVLPLEAPLSAAFGVLFGAAAQTTGWPVPQGGSAAIAQALAAELASLGGSLQTGTMISSLDQLPPVDITLLDVGPHSAAALLGKSGTARCHRALTRWRYGPGVYKVDYLLDGRVPWADPRVAQAGTVHLGGELAEVAAAERAAHSGGHPRAPFVLLAQPGQVDDTRAPAGQQVVWAYCHVPHGSSVPVGDRIDQQIERFAPGFRDRFLARKASAPADLQAWDVNLVGGDVVGGSMSGTQSLLRPTRSLRPYATPVPGVFLCSASTPPGGGVHGMCGQHAAQTALTYLRRSRKGTR